jgi:hypothetical protein
MNEDEIRKVVKHTVHETLTTLGVDVSSPEAILAMQADHAYLRRAREGADEVAKWVKRAAIGVGTTGGLWALWEGIKIGARTKGGG